MVRFSSVATGLGATATAVSGLVIRDAHETEVHNLMYFDPDAASSFTESDVQAETVHYDAAAMLAMGSLTAEASNHTDVELAERTIYGVDDRQDWTNSDYPYSAIGKVLLSNGGRCSGTLIGPRHVLTARHCTPKEGEAVSVRFAPFYYNGETRFPGSQVTTYIYYPGGNANTCEFGSDWAIHILQDRLGDQRGYFGARPMTSDMLNRDIYYNVSYYVFFPPIRVAPFKKTALTLTTQQFGYPGDRNNGERPVRSGGGRINSQESCSSEGPWWSNIDAQPGQSGGPVWEYPGTGGRYVQGVLTGTAATQSVVTSSQLMVNTIVAVRNDFP
ncbi:trypsin-like cysteine/serine peptidase domain-containing protein [Microdochium trichocladiopsis]|uniref:Serine protease n=1 Tax=Microdochium trichocladiopsis TaxID=1682393 RepID=A0A9P8Y731_9PEZI|nr:trypsin-like cysteine/serine peptidase domain-containing protein [Microdochium trichocladiopsis]KAH7031511.1 trypsin-like cysteine/serine peptidase domain-containing protein [Microdochium trichocladiopsis]